MIGEHSGLRRLGNNRCHLIEGVRTDGFGFGLNAGHPQETIRDRVQASNNRRDDPGDKHQRGRQEQHGLVGQ